MAANFNRTCINDYKNRVEDDKAEFIGAEFCGARIIGYISSQHAQGELSNDAAEQLLADAHHMMKLSFMGRKYLKLAVEPSPELRMLIIQEEQIAAQQAARAEGKMYA